MEKYLVNKSVSNKTLIILTYCQSNVTIRKGVHVMKANDDNKIKDDKLYLIGTIPQIYF